MKIKKIYLKAFLFLLFLFIITSCAPSSSTQPVAYVDLNNLQHLPTPEDEDIVPLRIAIAAVISPKGSAESYGPLLDYISEQLGRPVERVQRRTYAEVNELVETGAVDLAFVCTSAYVVGRRDFDMQLLVVPMVDGETYYHSQLIVPSNSSATSIIDLKGKVFAFTDPMSFSGRMYPTYLLHQFNETPVSFFQGTFFTYSHDDAIRAVANGLADGAAVDSLVLDFSLARDPSLSEKIKIIYTSPPFGIPPVVVGTHLRPQLRAQLSEVFLNMHDNDAGLEALQSLDLDKFTIGSEDLYKSVEEIEEVVASQIAIP
jgi:phosphonate transport system substrate-binding protein